MKKSWDRIRRSAFWGSRRRFNGCGRLENSDLIRRLSFGDYVLLQPELLDAYASALVIAAAGKKLN